MIAVHLRKYSGRLPASTRSILKIGRARAFELSGSARFSSPALSNLDQKLSSYLPNSPGVFLEIGANDGYSQSNTYYLERILGWRGVLIEPLPSLYRICTRTRRRSACFNVACVDEGHATSVSMIDRDLMSVSLGLQDADEEAERLGHTRRKRISVPARTLSSVIDEAAEPRIDFMSIDVEGSELSVLGGLNLAKHTPGHLLVETRHPAAISNLLGERMRLIGPLTHHDYLYARVEHRRSLSAAVVRLGVDR